MRLDREERKKYYEGELLRAAARVLSAADRCPVSASSGCLDREYWAWATKDFANADMQRGLLVPAYLFSTPFTGNDYHGRGALIDWIARGVAFWISRQHGSGAFDHLYPSENSWMAAAFTLHDLAWSYSLIGDEVEAGLRGRWMDAMRRAAGFLTRRDETHGFISNHRLGAAAALMLLAKLAGEDAFAARARELADSVFNRQSPEGWFVEYEGADPGYQTLATHYLALYKEHGGGTGSPAAAASLEFLSYFVHPDGSIGGEYGSRGCPHFFPGGVEWFAKKLPIAETIAARCARGLAAGASSGLADSDDRNSVPLATSYVLAHSALSAPVGAAPAQPPFERVFERVWPEAGFYVRSDERSYIVFGASKGGTVKIYDKKKPGLVYSSCGYAGRLNSGKHITTHLWTSRPEMETDGLAPGAETALARSRRVSVRSGFFEFRPDRLMSPATLVAFRIFNLTLGRCSKLNDFVRRRLIIGRYLTRRRRAPISLTRTLEADGQGINIIDELALTGRRPPAELREYGFLSAVYMASAKYFRTQDLEQSWIGDDIAGDFVSGKLTRKKTVTAD